MGSRSAEARRQHSNVKKDDRIKRQVKPMKPLRPAFSPVEMEMRKMTKRGYTTTYYLTDYLTDHQTTTQTIFCAAYRRAEDGRFRDKRQMTVNQRQKACMQSQLRLQTVDTQSRQSMCTVLFLLSYPPTKAKQKSHLGRTLRVTICVCVSGQMPLQCIMRQAN